MSVSRARPKRIVFGGFLILGLGAVGWAGLVQLSSLRDLSLCRALGYLAFASLLAALSVTPLQVRLKASSVWLSDLRRSLGLASAGFALLHGVAVLNAGYVSDAWPLVLEPQLRSGAGALLILLVLAASSFPKLVRSLRMRHWKVLHRSVFLAGMLALHHVLLSSFAGWLALAVLSGVLALCVLLRLLRRS